MIRSLKRTMVGSDAHGCSVFLANFYKRSKSLTDPFKFCIVSWISILYVFKLFCPRSCRIYPNFSTIRAAHSAAFGWNEYQQPKGEYPFFSNSFLMFSRFSRRWYLGRNTHQFTTGFYHTDTLFSSSQSIHGVCLWSSIVPGLDWTRQFLYHPLWLQWVNKREYPVILLQNPGMKKDVAIKQSNKDIIIIIYYC